MCLFSAHTKNAKMGKYIVQLKNKLTSMHPWHSRNSNFENISNIFERWKQKSYHTLHHFHNHAIQLKKKSKDNPKTTIALATGVVLTSFFLIRKLTTRRQ
ncbi:hypothetical protein NMK50_09055 [Bartonella harrusi]|uniref:Uncharacterized protein n=1 Tax=Bartonella harrusi TaxID=2961895 RepID=A0ABY5EV18_9HYPH|nr:hypothetical protein [Bartonella harrusi]UTO28270.1 hypothetical protein NMK50_09055 [Bartonella harrusi]